MNVDHGRFDTGVAEQRLHGANDITSLEETRGERVAQPMAAHVAWGRRQRAHLIEQARRPRLRRHTLQTIHENLPIGLGHMTYPKKQRLRSIER